MLIPEPPEDLKFEGEVSIAADSPQLKNPEGQAKTEPAIACPNCKTEIGLIAGGSTYSGDEKKV